MRVSKTRRQTTRQWEATSFCRRDQCVSLRIKCYAIHFQGGAQPLVTLITARGAVGEYVVL
jgi:hypothetical protein